MSDDWVMVPREPTIRMLAEGEHAMDRLGWERFTKAVWERMLDAAPAAPQQAEPVGYFVNDESDDQWHQVDYEQRNGADTYPLYLHPPAAEVQRLRDAAGVVMKQWAAKDDLALAIAMNELRRALEGGE